MAISKTEMKMMLSKIGRVELELLWIKEKLLPKTKATKSEIRAIQEARKEIARGEWISGDEFIKQLG